MKPYLKLKRIMDLVFGTVLLTVLTPLLIFTAAVLALDGPDKIFFVQKRIGKDAVPFTLFKLRSMKANKKGKPMITAIGKWLRKYRIDEIPQLINVVRGDMSLVGPRPEVPYFARQCAAKIPFYDAIYAIKPGLTGWAQVSFGHTSSVKEYKEKFKFNLYYLKNISLTLDLLILVKTIRTVIRGKGQ
jgi:lipopolysaccharide/colanic/teichoic acid biosynthesis glycosyltransferase